MKDCFVSFCCARSLKVALMASSVPTASHRESGISCDSIFLINMCHHHSEIQPVIVQQINLSQVSSQWHFSEACTEVMLDDLTALIEQCFHLVTSHEQAEPYRLTDRKHKRK